MDFTELKEYIDITYTQNVNIGTVGLNASAMQPVRYCTIDDFKGSEKLYHQYSGDS